MRARVVLITLVVAAIASIVSISLYKARSSPGRAWLADQIRRAVIRNDVAADSDLSKFFSRATPQDKKYIERECFQRVMQGLNTPDNVLWKPFHWIQAQAPPSIARLLKHWQDPRITRHSAASWLLFRSDAEMFSSNSCVIVSPVLLNLAKTDPDSLVRESALWALGTRGCFSSGIEQLMIEALHHPDMRDRQAATTWFARNTVAADKVVPLLLRGLEDDAMRSDYADALRAYGPKATFVADVLISLARTNNPATSSVATWALMGIDQEAAKRAGVK
jgi:hypothetical protein